MQLSAVCNCGPPGRASHCATGRGHTHDRRRGSRLFHSCTVISLPWTMHCYAQPKGQDSEPSHSASHDRRVCTDRYSPLDPSTWHNLSPGAGTRKSPSPHQCLPGRNPPRARFGTGSLTHHALTGDGGRERLWNTYSDLTHTMDELPGHTGMRWIRSTNAPAT